MHFTFGTNNLQNVYQLHHLLRVLILKHQMFIFVTLHLQNPNLVDFLGVHIEVGGGKITPCLKLVRIARNLQFGT